MDPIGLSSQLTKPCEWNPYNCDDILLAQVVGTDQSYHEEYAKCHVAKISGNHFFSEEALGLSLLVMESALRIFGHSAYKWKVL
jgi:hypothetical protein